MQNQHMWNPVPVCFSPPLRWASHAPDRVPNIKELHYLFKGSPLYLYSHLAQWESEVLAYKDCTILASVVSSKRFTPSLCLLTPKGHTPFEG